MQLQGTRLIAADRQTVWEALNDPDVLEASIPGCTELEKTSDTTMEATVVAKVGPVKATFRGAVELTDVHAPESYTISGEGKGGVAGFAKGSARVTLAEAEDGTELAYEAEAKVGGKLAQLGSRVVDGFAKRMAEEFFTNFKDRVEGPSEAEAEAEAEAPNPPEAGRPAADPERGPGRSETPEAAQAGESAAEAAPGGGSEAALPPEKKGFFKRLFG